MTKLTDPNFFSDTTRRVSEPLRRLRGEVDRLFEDYEPSARRLFQFGETHWPRLDLKEKDEQFEVTVDVAGYTEEQIDLSVVDGTLQLRGERDSSEDREEEGLIVHERHAGRFDRRINFPTRIDAEGIKATLDQGVLTVVAPKLPDPTARKVKISGPKSTKTA